MFEIVGIGAAVCDTIYSLPEYPAEDTKLRALGVKRCGGGPAATGIVAAAKLGARCAFLGCLAEDEGGRFLREDFRRYGVDAGMVEMIPGRRSFTSAIWVSEKSGTRTCVFDKGDLPPLTLSEAQKEAVRRAKILMVDGNELPAALEAAAIARESGTKVLYDAGGRYPGVEQLLALADILIPSEEFAKGITGAPDAARAAELLAERFRPETVAVTCGKRGGVFLRDGKPREYPIYPAEVIDSNGAGDVFHGAFAAALLRGFGARESVPDYDTTISYLRRNGYEL